MNRETRRLLGVAMYRPEDLDHCERCGAPMCPSCGEETYQCDTCSVFHCDCGWEGIPLSTDGASLLERAMVMPL